MRNSRGHANVTADVLIQIVMSNKEVRYVHVQPKKKKKPKPQPEAPAEPAPAEATPPEEVKDEINGFHANGSVMDGESLDSLSEQLDSASLDAVELDSEPATSETTGNRCFGGGGSVVCHSVVSSNRSFVTVSCDISFTNWQDRFVVFLNKLPTRALGRLECLFFFFLPNPVTRPIFLISFFLS